MTSRLSAGRSARRSARRSVRRGFALPAALIALVIIALFVAGSTFFAMQEARAARNAVTEVGALEAAEYGAVATLRDWNATWNVTVPAGVTAAPATHVLAGGATASVRITRLTPTTFWTVSEGTAGGASPGTEARRRVSAYYRLDVLDPVVGAALTVRDSVEVRGSGLVTGIDTTPGAPRPMPTECLGAGPAAAGIAAPDTTRICDGTCAAGGTHVAGLPSRLEEPFASDPLRYAMGGAGLWAALAQRAAVVLPPNATITPGPAAGGPGCLASVPTNWGDPAAGTPCADYLPVIRALGDLTLNGGSGQGVLLVDGDLRLAGGASFTGVVVAGDDIVTLAGGGTIIGAAFAGDRIGGSGDHTRIDDGGAVRYSSCAVGRALLGTALPRRVRQRWWTSMN